MRSFLSSKLLRKNGDWIDWIYKYFRLSIPNYNFEFDIVRNKKLDDSLSSSVTLEYANFILKNDKSVSFSLFYICYFQDSSKTRINPFSRHFCLYCTVLSWVQFLSFYKCKQTNWKYQTNCFGVFLFLAFLSTFSLFIF